MRQPVLAYQGPIDIGLPLLAAPGLKGERMLRLTFTYQRCDTTRCGQVERLDGVEHANIEEPVPESFSIALRLDANRVVIPLRRDDSVAHPKVCGKKRHSPRWRRHSSLRLIHRVRKLDAPPAHTQATPGRSCRTGTPARHQFSASGSSRMAAARQGRLPLVQARETGCNTIGQNIFWLRAYRSQENYGTAWRSRRSTATGGPRSSMF